MEIKILRISGKVKMWNSSISGKWRIFRLQNLKEKEN